MQVEEVEAVPSTLVNTMQALSLSSSPASSRGNGLPQVRPLKSRGGYPGNRKRRGVGTRTIVVALLLGVVPMANIFLRLYSSTSKDGKGETADKSNGLGREENTFQSEEDSLSQRGVYDRKVVPSSVEGDECDSAVSKKPPAEEKPPVAELPPKVGGEKLDRKKQWLQPDVHGKRKKSFEKKRVLTPPEGSVLPAAHHNTTSSGFGRKRSKYPTPWVEYGGQGGKVSDGRNRCFVDSQGDHRCYPTVFFFGTSKCGTTSLARWLARHPVINWVANPRRPTEIEDTGVKEAHVFDDSPKGTREQMEKSHHEKLFTTSPKATSEEVIIDYTPHYIAVAEVPHRIADLYGPKAGLKFVVTLREPVSRTISSWEFKNMYNSKKQRPEELRPLSEAVKQGKKRAMKLEDCITKANAKGASSRERDLQTCNPRRFLELPLYVSHIGKSMYAQQLERWFDIFGRENFKVVFTDDMAADPVRVLEDVLTFLGLDFASEDGSKAGNSKTGLPTRSKWAWITTMAYNKTKSDKKSELQDQVTDKIKEELKEFFRPHNRRLEKLLGVPVPDSWN